MATHEHSHSDSHLMKVIEKSLENTNIIIKKQQFAALKNILKGKDTLCILPTSFGKSLIYQLVPSVCKEIEDQPKNPLVICLSPLVSLIKDQVKAANSSTFGLKAVHLDVTLYEQISAGNYNLIIGTPENWLNKKWRSLLTSQTFTKNLVCIVVDEVHKVTWGTVSQDSIKPFREAFGQISVLRSLCRGKVPILALSATIDFDLTTLVIESCNLSSKLKIITSFSDRRNIRLSVVPIKRKDFTHLQWILDMIVDKKELCPKIIIYCRTLKLVGWVYCKLLKNLLLTFPEGTSKSLIGMYHSMTDEENKTRVLQSLTSDQETLTPKVIIATSSSNKLPWLWSQCQEC